VTVARTWTSGTPGRGVIPGGTSSSKTATAEPGNESPALHLDDIIKGVGGSAFSSSCAFGAKFLLLPLSGFPKRGFPANRQTGIADAMLPRSRNAGTSPFHQKPCFFPRNSVLLSQESVKITEICKKYGSIDRLQNDKTGWETVKKPLAAHSKAYPRTSDFKAPG
jgi:hypothetical protein